jgi:hypothetical protein
VTENAPFRPRVPTSTGSNEMITWKNSSATSRCRSERGKTARLNSIRATCQPSICKSDGGYWAVPYSDRRLPAVTPSELNLRTQATLEWVLSHLAPICSAADVVGALALSLHDESTPA